MHNSSAISLSSVGGMTVSRYALPVWRHGLAPPFPCLGKPDTHPWALRLGDAVLKSFALVRNITKWPLCQRRESWIAVRTRSGVAGIWRTRPPEAWLMALRMAGVVASAAASPRPLAP